MPLGTGYFARAFGTAFGIPVQETGTKGHLQPVPMALFLVVDKDRNIGGFKSQYSLEIFFS